MRGEAVDCIPSLLTNGRPAPILSELTTTVGVRILPIPDDVMMKAKALNPGISIGMIPGGKVPGIDQETGAARSEEHTSELQSLMRISYAVVCLKKIQTTTQLA